MANRLEMAMIQAIQQLHAAGLSRRAIARTLGVHPDTVAEAVEENDWGAQLKLRRVWPNG